MVRIELAQESPQRRDARSSGATVSLQVRAQCRHRRELTSTRILAGNLERDAVERMCEPEQRAFHAGHREASLMSDHERGAVVRVVDGYGLHSRADGRGNDDLGLLRGHALEPVQLAGRTAGSRSIGACPEEGCPEALRSRRRYGEDPVRVREHALDLTLDGPPIRLDLPTREGGAVVVQHELHGARRHRSEK